MEEGDAQMNKSLVILCMVALLLIIGVWVNRAMTPPPVILDVPGVMASGHMPGRSMQERQEARMFYSKCTHGQIRSLEVASLTPGGKPEIISGEFIEPIRGRSRAMWMLGTEDSYAVVSRASGMVEHRGGPFAEFRLFRTSPDVDEYGMFFAATSAGLAALE
jgi:hypothetical protein